MQVKYGICLEKKTVCLKSWKHDYHGYIMIIMKSALSVSQIITLLFIQNFIFNMIILILGPQWLFW